MSRNNRRNRNPRIDLIPAHREECEALKPLLIDELFLRRNPREGVVYPTFVVSNGLFISRGVFQSLRPDIAEHLPTDQTEFTETFLGGQQARFQITAKSDCEGLYSLSLFGVLDDNVHTYYEPHHVPGQGEEHDATYNLYYLGGSGLLAFLPDRLDSAKYVAGVALAWHVLSRVGFEFPFAMKSHILSTCHELYPENKHLAKMPALLSISDDSIIKDSYDFVTEATGLIRQGFEDMLLSADVRSVLYGIPEAETIELNITTNTQEIAIMNDKSALSEIIELSKNPHPAALKPMLSPEDLQKEEVVAVLVPPVIHPALDLSAVVEKSKIVAAEKTADAVVVTSETTEKVTVVVTEAAESNTVLPADHPSMAEDLANYRHTMGIAGHASQAKDESTGAIMGVLQQGIDKATDYIPSKKVMLGVAGAIVGLALIKSLTK